MQQLISIDQLTTEIQILIKEGSINEAINHCTNALTLQPLNSDILQQRAILYFISMQLDKAREDIQKALLLKGGKKLSNNFLLSLIGDTVDKKNKDGQKPESSSDVLKDVNYYRKITVIYLSIKMYDEVIKFVKEAEDVGINDDDIFFNAAIAYSNLKRFDEALIYYAKALAINANNLDIFYHRINTYFNMSPPQYDRALDDANLIIQRHKSQAKAYAKRAYILFHQEKYDHAIEDCSRAIQIDENNLEAFYTLARCHYAVHGFYQAAAAAEVVMALDPNMVEGYCVYAMAACEIDQHAAVIEICNKGLEIDNQIALLYHVRSCSNMALGKYNEANEDCERACQLCAENKENYCEKLHLAKLKYEDLVIKYINDEPKQNESLLDQLRAQERITKFIEHEKNMLNIITKTKANDYIHLIFTFCLGELYAKCQYTYFAQYEDKDFNRNQKEHKRIDKSARYYINALNGLLNNVVISVALEANKLRRLAFDFFKQNKLPETKKNGFSNAQLAEMKNAEMIRAQQIRLMIDVVMCINQLYVQSEQSKQFFRTNLPVNFKEVLKKCLNQSLKELASEKEATILWQHLEQHKDNIFSLFDIPVVTHQNGHAHPHKNGSLRI